MDIVREAGLIEIQTRNLAALRRKLHALLQHHPVRLMYPIAQEKWIVRKTGSRKKDFRSDIIPIFGNALCPATNADEEQSSSALG